MGSTASTINVSSGSSTVSFNVESSPSNPTVKLSSNQSWATTGNSSISVTSYSGVSERSATITITATTTANSEYNGTASATSSYTLTQAPRINRDVTINGPSISVTVSTSVQITFYLSLGNNQHINIYNPGATDSYDYGYVTSGKYNFNENEVDIYAVLQGELGGRTVRLW